HAGFGLGDGLEHDPSVAIEQLAGLGQREAAGASSQQAGPEPLLEPSQATADRRAWDAELDGRTRQRLGLDHAREREQLGGFDRIGYLDHFRSNADTRSNLVPDGRGGILPESCPGSSTTSTATSPSPSST